MISNLYCRVKNSRIAHFWLSLDSYRIVHLPLNFWQCPAIFPWDYRGGIFLYYALYCTDNFRWSPKKIPFFWEFITFFLKGLLLTWCNAVVCFCFEVKLRISDWCSLIGQQSMFIFLHQFVFSAVQLWPSFSLLLLNANASFLQFVFRLRVHFK